MLYLKSEVPLLLSLLISSSLVSHFLLSLSLVFRLFLFPFSVSHSVPI